MSKCYDCVRGKVCRENVSYPCGECAGYVAEPKTTKFIKVDRSFKTHGTNQLVKRLVTECMNCGFDTYGRGHGDFNYCPGCGAKVER